MFSQRQSAGRIPLSLRKGAGDPCMDLTEQEAAKLAAGICEGSQAPFP